MHKPLSRKDLDVIASKTDILPFPEPAATDSNGIPTKHLRLKRLQAKLSQFFYGVNIPRPTDNEIEQGQAHARMESLEEKPLQEVEKDAHIPVGHGGVIVLPQEGEENKP